MTNYRHIHVEMMKDVAVVTFVTDKLNDDAAAQECVRELGTLQKHRKVLIDFSGLTHVSSSVLNKLCALKKEMSNHRLRLCALAEPVSEIFEITRLCRNFDMYLLREDALRDWLVS